MASEIRVNQLTNRSGLGTITFANGGVQFSGITTFANGEFYVGTGATIINPSSNEFNFHTGGSNRFTINNSGVNIPTLTATTGTFSGNVSIGGVLTYEDVKNVDSIGIITARSTVSIADSIVHTGDTNTSLRFPAADTITAETAGSARLRIHPTGQVTIGSIAATTDKSGILHTKVSNTTSPVVFENDTENADVIIRTTGSNKHSILGFGDGADNFIGNIDYDHQNNAMVFDTSGGERLSISSSGLVTQVETGTGNGQGGIKASTASAGGNAGFGFITGGTQRFSVVTIGSAGSEALRVYDVNNSAERFRIDSDGRVIIGDTSTGNAFSGGDSLVIGNTTSGTRTGMTLVSHSGQDSGVYFSRGTSSSSNYVKGQIVYNHPSDYMAFYVTGTNRAVSIDGNGYVTMGRNDALASARLSLQCTSGDPGISIQTNASAGTSDLIKAYSSAGPNVASICVNPDSTPDLLFKVHNGSSTVERLRLDSSGRLIVGGDGGHTGGGATFVVKGNSNTLNSYACAAFCKIGANPTSGTTLANLRFSGGSGGTNRAAEINVKCDANWSDGSSQASKMELGVSDSGGTSAGSPSLTLKAGGDVEINRGDLVMASGKGINFAADPNASGKDNELLDDYEEGDWTPTPVITYQGGSGSLSSISDKHGRYVKIGHMVQVWFYFRFTGSNITNCNVGVSGLPFTITNDAEWNNFTAGVARRGVIGGETYVCENLIKNTTQINVLRKYNNTGFSNSDQSITGVAHYLVD